MKPANSRHTLPFALILAAIAVAVSFAYAGTYGQRADETSAQSPQPMMFIPF